MDWATINVDEGQLRLRAEQKQHELHLTLTGSAELGAMAVLDRVLGEVHGRVTNDGIERVVVDLRQLEFMNSSCFKSFVGWLSEVEDLPVDKRYRITFRSSSSRHWQRRSLSALSCFAVELVTVEQE